MSRLLFNTQFLSKFRPIIYNPAAQLKKPYSVNSVKQENDNQSIEIKRKEKEITTERTLRKSYGYEGNPLAPLIEPPNNIPATPDRYLVNIKKSIDEARINYHFDRLNEDINKELKKGVVSYIHKFTLYPCYRGQFSKEILEKIRRSDVIDSVKKDYVFAKIPFYKLEKEVPEF